MSNKKTKNDNELRLNELGIPMHVAHVKPGNTLYANDNIVILQNGATTLEVCTAPKFELKQIPWNEGLIRDIIWCSELNLFLLLTKQSLFAFNPKSINLSTIGNGDIQLKTIYYANVKPYDDKNLFWRIACDGTKLFICYAGCGAAVDEYIIGSSSCKMTNRWYPPQTCAPYEGIWCIRAHPNTNVIGLTIVNPQNNAWRFETRDSKTFGHLGQMYLPIRNGDCELSPLAHGEWLIINSCGARLVQIENVEMKLAVEYERELKNAIPFKKDYFIVRTKNTLEVHSTKKKDK